MLASKKRVEQLFPNLFCLRASYLANSGLVSSIVTLPVAIRFPGFLRLSPPPVPLIVTLPVAKRFP
eukprot:8110774-Pyramimonas_sp.AAC.1